ncbi:MAG: type IV pilus twitching motility protein PilT [candidate division KSB1 bacterium]|nr:type IV pilus twitching motility protein PilT [candidate division KSB1 bacterium]MDQ7065821.1 type IV pilus twitching motility protein PilT [candidate division KSB1 bacterium]
MTRQELDRLLSYAVEKEASDIHLSAGLAPMLRIHGTLRRLDTAPVKREALEHLIAQILNEKQKKHFAQYQELDFAYAIAGVARFRTNIYCQLRGLAIAFRVIPDRVRSLEELGCPPGLYTLARQNKGIVLVTGPTGSGKSTTLAAMLDLINRERRDHILTIEDPIEYVHTPKNCLINQRELGEHTQSFANALRAALREDPDVILVGEMRDLETISLALTAAETGHLVFATLHTMNAAETVNRIVDVFPPEQQRQVRAMFANAVMGIVAQRLLPRADGRGRVAVHEIMIATNAIRNLIREEKSHQIHSVIQTGAQYGMQTIDMALARLLKQGVISREIAEAHAHDKRVVLSGGGEG